MQKTAESQGFNQVLWLYGEDNQITEVGTMNLFIVHLNEKGGTFLAYIFDFCLFHQWSISVCFQTLGSS